MRENNPFVFEQKLKKNMIKELNEKLVPIQTLQASAVPKKAPRTCTMQQQKKCDRDNFPRVQNINEIAGFRCPP